MTYVMSDVHGEYSVFLDLLSKINFSKQDTLYICGDIMEKGPHTVRLAKYIFAHDNIHVIRGNHEEEFIKYFQSLMLKRDGDYDVVLDKLREYIGGEDGNLLDWETVDRIELLPYYIETPNFICVHAGVPLDSRGKIPDLSKAPAEELIYNRRFKQQNILPNDEKCVFYGHTPSMSIYGESRIVAFYRDANEEKSITNTLKVHLDTGVYISGILGCFCVDTCQSIYVKKVKTNSK